MSTIVINSRGSRSVVLDQIAQALAGLEFGAVEITVHHGRIVQIERREKVRLDAGHRTRPEADTSGKPTS